MLSYEVTTVLLSKRHGRRGRGSGTVRPSLTAVTRSEMTSLGCPSGRMLGLFPVGSDHRENLSRVCFSYNCLDALMRCGEMAIWSHLRSSVTRSLLYSCGFWQAVYWFPLIAIGLRTERVGVTVKRKTSAQAGCSPAFQWLARSPAVLCYALDCTCAVSLLVRLLDCVVIKRTV